MTERKLEEPLILKTLFDIVKYKNQVITENTDTNQCTASITAVVMSY